MTSDNDISTPKLLDIAAGAWKDIQKINISREDKFKGMQQVMIALAEVFCKSYNIRNDEARDKIYDVFTWIGDYISTDSKFYSARLYLADPKSNSSIKSDDVRDANSRFFLALQKYLNQKFGMPKSNLPDKYTYLQTHSFQGTVA